MCHGTRQGCSYLFICAAARGPFLHETKTNHHKKNEFFNDFFSVAESHSSFDMISNRSKILLYGVLKIPLQKHTEQTQDK